jgi:hypothetical protein
MGHEGMGMMRHGMGTMHREPDEDRESPVA